MRLGRYNTIAECVLGKLLIVPDTLSHDPLSQMDSNTTKMRSHPSEFKWIASK